MGLELHQTSFNVVIQMGCTLWVALWGCFFLLLMVTCVQVTLSLMVSDGGEWKVLCSIIFTPDRGREHQERGKCIGGLGISSVIDLFRSTICSWLNSNCPSRKGKCICLSKKYPFFYDGRNGPFKKPNQEFSYSTPYSQNSCHVFELSIFLIKSWIVPMWP